MPPRHKASIVAQSTLALYLQAIEWIDLFPWNDVRKGNGQETLDLALAAMCALAILATWRRWRPGLYFACLFYLVWLALQIATFWVPYVLGASPRWQRIHALHFGETTQILPIWGAHLPPDACHFLLQLLLVAALVPTYALLRGSRRSSGH